MNLEMPAFERVVPEQPSNDEEISGTNRFEDAQETEDLRWPASVQGYRKYWLSRLTSEEGQTNLPPPLAEVVSRYRTEQQTESFVMTTKERKALDKHISLRLRDLKSRREKSQKIDNLSQEKRQEMSNLKAELRRIDKQEEMEPSEILSRRALFHDAAKDAFFVEEPEGKRRYVTEGDIAGDLLWGVKYRPDASVPSTTWRRLRKFSLIRETRARITDAWNRELAVRERLTLPSSSMTPEFIEEHPQSGMVAERMMQSLFTRVQHDHPEFGLEIEASNAYEDAQLKYDFKIVVSKRTRGVAIYDQAETREAYVEKKRRLGIQFTISQNKDNLKYKAQQVRSARSNLGKKDPFAKPVDDIVLVAVPLEGIAEVFVRWIADGKPSGGPERYLSEDTKNQMIHAITRNLPGFGSSGSAS